MFNLKPIYLFWENLNAMIKVKVFKKKLQEAFSSVDVEDAMTTIGSMQPAQQVQLLKQVLSSIGARSQTTDNQLGQIMRTAANKVRGGQPSIGPAGPPEAFSPPKTGPGEPGAATPISPQPLPVGGPAADIPGPTPEMPAFGAKVPQDFDPSGIPAAPPPPAWQPSGISQAAGGSPEPPAPAATIAPNAPLPIKPLSSPGDIESWLRSKEQMGQQPPSVAQLGANIPEPVNQQAGDADLERQMQARSQGQPLQMDPRLQQPALGVMPKLKSLFGKK